MVVIGIESWEEIGRSSKPTIITSEGIISFRFLLLLYTVAIPDVIYNEVQGED